MTDIVHGDGAMQPTEPVLSRWFRTVDHRVLIAILALFLIGLLLGLAASPPLAERLGRDSYAYVYRHITFGAVALSVMVALSTLSVSSARRIGLLIFGISFCALILLPFFGTDFGKGATRWFSLGFASIQPSEFLKPGFVILCAWLISGSMQQNGPPGTVMSLMFMVTITFLLAMQPDFGQASLLIFVWCVMYFVSGASVLPLVGVGAITSAAGVIAYHSSEHLARRINDYLKGEIDAGTQLGFSLNAIREGGLLGVGIGQGTVKEHLPDAHTDFIVAVAAEEYGIGLVFLVIGLFSYICLRSMFRLINERDPFARLAGMGLASLFGIQAFIHLAVSVGLLPAKGLTLPFISYGGSSMIAIGASLGLLLALTRTKDDEDLSGYGPGRWKLEFRDER